MVKPIFIPTTFLTIHPVILFEFFPYNSVFFLVIKKLYMRKYYIELTKMLLKMPEFSVLYRKNKIIFLRYKIKK